MRYSLLNNGIDSLKATANSLNALGENDFVEPPYHHMKDAILSINHANEILFKYLLKIENEHLIYRDLEAFIKAKRQMVAEGIKNVMDTKVRLDTVNLFEAIERLEFICEFEIPLELKKVLTKLNGYRNKIMHYEIELSEDTVGQIGFMISKAYEKTIEYFNTYVEDFEDMLEEARIELTVEDYWEQYADDAYESYRDAKLDWEADMADLAEQRRGGFNRD
ncbi:hypothetical protein [Metabacillus rhizolycopersici]|uniref:DUF4145 domain-containing protein n=1 Tax=Metabacillus rhizolycopersici TaxID=2875709 RepID=A0ABS7UZH5_9BACI|nr:hypothetical protein [Metabacillus rhizolycopersici]MBZ5753727.1 hypothetical protein [Metabacillus rhizolycopersici]